MCFTPSSTPSSARMSNKPRCASLALLVFMAGSSLFAAANHEATYTVGNLDSFHAGTAGFVRVDDAGIMFRNEDAVVDIPYARITSTTLTPKDALAPNPPGYKVWDRMGSKKHQNLIVNFKDAAGKDQTMTLEVRESTAHEIHDTLVVRTPFQASSPVVAAKQSDALKAKTKEPAAEKKQAKVKDPAPEKQQAKAKDAARPKQTADAKDTAQPKETAAQAVEKPVQAKAKPVKVKEETAKGKAEPAKAKTESIQANEKPAKTKEKPVQAKEKPAEVKEQSKQAKIKPVHANKHQEQAKVQPAEQPKAQPAEQTKAQSSESTSWWGDQYWKTARNRDSWATQSAAITK